MLDNSTKEKLLTIAKQMVTPGKGILAADESIKTVDKRFQTINLENNEQNRQQFREMLLTVPHEGDYISGVILFDETIRQNADDGRTFVTVLQDAGILPGIKVDGGLYEMPSSPSEKLTHGLEGLDQRLKDYVRLGAVFCKWRAVITISETTPTDQNIRQNARDLISYAKICQDNGLVPMVEPEVLMDGNHTRAQAESASRKILTALFDEAEKSDIFLEGLILKTSMVISGKESGEKETSSDVAHATVDLFTEVLPQKLAGVVFLSGGQTEIQATENLNAIHQLGTLPWPVTFSYARALQDGATRLWEGKKENIQAAQRVFLHRAHMNSLASLGEYTPKLESEIA